MDVRAPERRIYERCVIWFPVTLRAGDDEIGTICRDASSGGLMVSSPVALLKDPKMPRYEEAHREFKAAYALSPSYKILGNLGLCAMQIERDEEAIHAYEAFLREGGPEVTSGERMQIERDLLTLKAGIVKVNISSDPPGHDQ